MSTFSEVLQAAVADFTERGFVSQQQLDDWVSQLRTAIAGTLAGQHAQEAMLREALQAIYGKLVDNAEVLRNHSGVDRYTLQQVAPRLRGELDRRILAGANLIKLNRVERVEQTLRRFQGWATSIPIGGSSQVDKREVKDDLSKAMRGLPFAERRVLVDQGHKLSAAISATVAEGSGAIAAKWFSHWRQQNYNYREDHRERDGLVYLVRNSWAAQQGLVRKGPPGYTDDVTQPAEEPFCRCRWTWLYNLRQLPEDMLTVKGREKLAAVRAQRAG